MTQSLTPSPLQRAEQARHRLAQVTSEQQRASLGQYPTPARLAQFMMTLFPDPGEDQVRLLDAGAGLGALTCAFFERFPARQESRSEVTAVELDASLLPQLEAHLRAVGDVQVRTVAAEFTEWAARSLEQGLGGFTHAVLNPPYRKIGVQSRERLALRRAGVETVNLYAGFLALTVALMDAGGQVVAIIPRSFCNGPYYRPFREFLLARAAIRRMHLFDSRRAAFKDAAVLQENIVLHLECGAAQGPVTVSTSSDDTLLDLTLWKHDADRIVFPDDPERFIHIPVTPEPSALEELSAVRASLADLLVSVSTGPVVDFRLREHLRDQPGPGSVPLIYPAHLSARGVTWPLPNFRKANAIAHTPETGKWLLPAGYYCAVRRLSSKEESRRVVATFVAPEDFGGPERPAMLGFENHLNVFHQGKRGLPEQLARGLTAYLNSTAVDEQVRRFSGHTQVNATDLRALKYPDRAALLLLGEWAAQHPDATQMMLDEALASCTLGA